MARKRRKQTGPPGTPTRNIGVSGLAQRSFKGKWIRFDEWINPSDWKKSQAKRRSPHSGPMGLPPKPWGASGITRTGTGGTVASSDFGKLERAADRQRRRMS